MRYRKNIFKDKSFLAMTGVSVLAIAAIAGGVLLQKQNDSAEPESRYIADLNGDESGNQKDSAGKETDSGDIAANNGAHKVTEDNTEEPQSTDDSSGENASEPSASEEVTTGSGELSEAGIGVSQFNFSAESTLVWPVETNDIIVEYSPDATIYFATLDKYKTSDAIAIRSEVGTPVYAAAPGTICDIGYNEEIGNNISLDLGSGYTLQYGQIKDIQVSEGDIVSEGDLLCYIAAPTKYYSVEGPNMYLKLSDSEGSVDPLDYLDYKD